jgi:hypothetical protein
MRRTDPAEAFRPDVRHYFLNNEDQIRRGWGNRCAAHAGRNLRQRGGQAPDARHTREFFRRRGNFSGLRTIRSERQVRTAGANRRESPLHSPFARDSRFARNDPPA